MKRCTLILGWLLVVGCQSAPERSDSLYIASGMPHDDVAAAIVANGGEDWSNFSSYALFEDDDRPFFDWRHYRLANGMNLTAFIDKEEPDSRYLVVGMRVNDSAGLRRGKIESDYGVNVVKIDGARMILWGLPERVSDNQTDSREDRRMARFIYQGMRWRDAMTYFDAAAPERTTLPWTLLGSGDWRGFNVGERRVFLLRDADQSASEGILKRIIVQAEPSEHDDGPGDSGPALVRFEVLDLNRPMPLRWEWSPRAVRWRPDDESPD